MDIRKKQKAVVAALEDIKAATSGIRCHPPTSLFDR
jgi:hypothetical protein